jgi:hypothetical protein
MLTQPAIAVEVRTIKELILALKQANQGGDRFIIVHDGTYTIKHLNSLPGLKREGVVISGKSRNPLKTIIQGDPSKWVTHIFHVAADDITIQNMTLRTVRHHLIQVHGENDADRVVIRNVRFINAGQQLLKVTADRKQKRTADNGLVESCWFEYEPGFAKNYYIGGIDAHFAKNWVIRENVFVGIKSPAERVAEFAVHFWTNSENTVVERNTIINCDRGIGFGLGKNSPHLGGTIKNNMIYHDNTQGYADVGIALESVNGAAVFNNTIFMEQDYPNAIEYRFPRTQNVKIINNLTNKRIQKRNHGQAQVKNNVTWAQKSWFVDPDKGDLHLKEAVEGVFNKGILLGDVILDIDGTVRKFRPGIDIGADEF